MRLFLKIASRFSFLFFQLDLVQVLNLSFPDYDFSSSSPDNFTRETSFDAVATAVDEKFASYVQDYELGIKPLLWRAMESVRGREGGGERIAIFYLFFRKKLFPSAWFSYTILCQKKKNVFQGEKNLSP
jgi:hypothetical protein